MLKTSALLLLATCLTLAPASHASEPATHGPLNQQMVLATLWQQHSAEARGLSYQAWNLARRILADDLAEGGEQSRAVVVDVDETVLDNTPFQVRCILDGTAYPTGWVEWCEEASARAMPGAAEFLNWADSQGVAVYYVSNRKVAVLEVSMQNLREMGFPQVDEDHCLFRVKDNSKESRREQIREKHRIAVLVGDNLGDFSEDFEGLAAQRNTAVDRLQQEFGSRFVLLPNAMYGNWEGSLGEGYYKLSDPEKMQLRENSLRRD